MLRLRTVLLVTVLLGGMAGSPPVAGAAPGEVVSGTLARDTGGETLAAGAVSFGGGSAGLTFAPSADLTEDGAVTRSVAVEALAESAENGNNGFNTLLSIAGGAYYRFRNGLTGANAYGMNGPQPRGHCELTRPGSPRPSPDRLRGTRPLSRTTAESHPPGPDMPHDHQRNSAAPMIGPALRRRKRVSAGCVAHAEATWPSCSPHSNS